MPAGQDEDGQPQPHREVGPCLLKIMHAWQIPLGTLMLQPSGLLCLAPAPLATTPLQGSIMQLHGSNVLGSCVRRC